MKLKYLLALFAGLLVTSTTMKADDGPDGAAVTVSASSANPNPVCVGSLVSVTFTATPTGPANAQKELKITGTNYSWAASDGTGWTTNQPNGSATWDPGWKPSACGSKTLTASVTVTFSGTQQTGTPNESSYTTTVSSGNASATVTVVDVDSLTPDFSSSQGVQGGLEGGSDPLTYWVTPCAGDIIVTATSCPNLTASQLPAGWSFTGGVEIDKLHRKVKKTDLASGSVIFVVTCGTTTKTIILQNDKTNAVYWATGNGGTCDCDDWVDPSPKHDKCGNSLAVDCADSVRYVNGICRNPGNFKYMYNGIWVGTCLYNGGMNSFLYKTTKHEGRILCTWHLTQRPTTPTKWTVTKYDCLSGSGPSQDCRVAPVWDGAWGNPADDLTQPGYPANSCENQGTSCP